jgi:hypothetical protein
VGVKRHTVVPVTPGADAELQLQVHWQGHQTERWVVGGHGSQVELCPVDRSAVTDRKEQKIKAKSRHNNLASTQMI